MPQLSLDIPHVLGLDEAARRLKERFTTARAEYQGHVSDFREEWRDHTFSFAFRALGMAVSGTVAVEQERIRLAAHLPLAAMFLKGAIEDRIRREVGILLAAPSSPLKKGTGSELPGAIAVKNGGCEVPVPLFQRAARTTDDTDQHRNDHS